MDTRKKKILRKSNEALEQTAQGDCDDSILEVFKKSVNVVLRASGHGGDELLVGPDDICSLHQP